MTDKEDKRISFQSTCHPKFTYLHSVKYKINLRERDVNLMKRDFILDTNATFVFLSSVTSLSGVLM